MSPVGKIQVSLDLSWVSGIRNNSAADFEAMYRFYYENLCQFAHRFVNDTATSEDLVHNVFLNIWKNRADWILRGSLRTYLYQSVRNQAMNHLAHKKVQNRSRLENLSIIPDPNRMNPEEKFTDEEFEEAVRKAVEQLPERRRIIWLMHREDKLTYREIAEVLDLSIKTVETQMSRSLKFLRERLTEFLPFVALIIILFR